MILELPAWQQDLCVAVSRRKVHEYANGLRGYYDALPWWRWIRRLRVAYQLRVVTVAQDAYQMGWQDGSKGLRW